MSILYFDFSQVVGKGEFDLKEYLQTSFASDFYKNEGSLQWNYYLYFVLDRLTYGRVAETPLLARIESDRTFARKFIKEQGELNKELGAPFIEALKVEKPSQDLASLWTEELKKAGLGKVADPSAEYANAVRDYLTESVETVRRVTALPDVAENGEFIRSLNWTKFREFPRLAKFDFGTVNLIRGVNGAGKTSLLEAIELSICGGIRRQGGKGLTGAKLEVVYAGAATPERCPSSSAQIYRARDRAWYGGYYRTGNNLCNNFGRFNLFDSDAAFQLSTADEVGSIQKAIKTLLLGELANAIEERMTNFAERFAREEKATDRVLKARKDLVDATAKQLEQLKAIKDTRTTLIEELKAKAEGCGWRKMPTKPALKDLVVLQEAVDNAVSELTEHREGLWWMGKISAASVQQELDLVKGAMTEIAGVQEEVAKIGTSLEKTEARIQAGERELEVLSRLLEYHNERDAMTLLGSGKALSAAATRLSQMEEALRVLRSVDLSPYASIRITPQQFIQKQAEDMREARQTLRALQARLQPLQSRIGEINSLIEEIRGMGRHYCEIAPGNNDCPLCGAHYDQLAERIAELEVTASVDEALRELSDQVAQQQERVRKAEGESETFAKVRRAAELVLGQEKATSTRVETIVGSLENLSEQIATARAAESELRGLITKLRIAGYEEEELEQLIDSGHEEYAHPIGRITNKESALALFNEKTHLVAELRKAHRDLEKAQGQLQARIERIHSRCFKDAEIEDPDVELERRGEFLEDVAGQIKEIKKRIAIEDEEAFSTIEKRLATFSKAIERAQQAFKSIEEKDALEQQLAATLSQAQLEVAQLTPRLTKAKKAVEVLRRLSGDDYKGKYLRQVRSEHAEKISKIFCQIHAPREFKSVVVEDIVTLERANGVVSQVSEISTGQRAALALSIFLSLNSSVDARAPWLLFDDPVVHVDDLNVLSFFDTLRDLVLLEKRQVFFATASAKLADLFAKKFDCLGSDFRDFRISR